MKIKFMWNGIKIDGKLFKAHYSDGSLTNHPEGTLTIYAKRYRPFPEIPGLNVQNDSDMMTDYFENDRIRVTPDNVFYNQVKEAISKANAHYDKIRGGKMKIEDKMRIVEASSIKDYLDKYHKRDRYTGRGAEYAEYLLQSYQEEFERRGYVVTSHHDNVTGEIIAWPHYPNHTNTLRGGGKEK